MLLRATGRRVCRVLKIEDDMTEQTCHKCHGSGREEIIHAAGHHMAKGIRACSACHGTGKTRTYSRQELEAMQRAAERNPAKRGSSFAGVIVVVVILVVVGLISSANESNSGSYYSGTPDPVVSAGQDMAQAETLDEATAAAMALQEATGHGDDGGFTWVRDPETGEMVMVQGGGPIIDPEVRPSSFDDEPQSQPDPQLLVELANLGNDVIVIAGDNDIRGETISGRLGSTDYGASATLVDSSGSELGWSTDLEWSSSDESILAISGTNPARFELIGEGTVTITVTDTNSGATAYFYFRVVDVGDGGDGR